ncbi:MAG: copper-binding protein [Hyphomonadaceae bacterium]
MTVTREHGAITIQHEAIPEYGMGAMTMEFTVADAASLEGIQPGDSVRFELSGPLDIASLSKIE